MDVSDRRLHVQLTQEAKIASDFSLFRAIFAFAGFVSALRRERTVRSRLLLCGANGRSQSVSFPTALRSSISNQACQRGLSIIVGLPSRSITSLR